MNVSGPQASVFYSRTQDETTAGSTLGKWTYRLKQRGKGALMATAAASTVVPATAVGALFFGFGAAFGPVFAWAHTRAVMRLGSLKHTPFSAPINVPTALAFMRYYDKAQALPRATLEAETRRFYTRFSNKNMAAVGSKIGTLSDENLRSLYAYNRYLERGGHLNLEGAGIEDLCRKRDKYLTLANDRLSRKREEKEPAIRVFRERLTALAEALGHPTKRTFRVDDSIDKFPPIDGPTLTANDWRGSAERPVAAPARRGQAAASHAAPLLFEEYFQSVEIPLRTNKASIEALYSASNQGGSMAHEPGWASRVQQQDALIERFVQGLLRAADQGRAVIFPQYVRQVTPAFCWKTLGFEGVRALTESGSNILSVTFDEGAVVAGHPNQSSYDWTQVEETLLSCLLKVPHAQDSEYHRFVAYALDAGADIHFKPCNLTKTHREYYSPGGVEESPGTQIEERQKGSEESLLYRAARNLDLLTMARLLDKGADPNVGRYLIDARIGSTDKSIDCGVLRALFEEAGKRPLAGSDVVEGFVWVVGDLFDKGLRLGARHGNPMPDTSVMRDAGVQHRLETILR